MDQLRAQTIMEVDKELFDQLVRIADASKALCDAIDNRVANDEKGDIDKLVWQVFLARVDVCKLLAALPEVRLAGQSHAYVVDEAGEVFSKAPMPTEEQWGRIARATGTFDPGRSASEVTQWLKGIQKLQACVSRNNLPVTPGECIFEAAVRIIDRMRNDRRQA